MFPLPNVQPRESQVHGDGQTVEIVGDPWSTIQGEGPYSGTPAVFVRLAGCSMDCPGCDSDYTTDRNPVPVHCLIGDIGNLKLARTHLPPLVVITGGEPLRQPIGHLVRELLYAGYFVQIETNGTLFQKDFPWSSPHLAVVCSPKAAKVHPDLVSYVRAYKYPIRAGEVDPEDGLPTSILGSGIKPARIAGWQVEIPIYVTPVDENDPVKNAANLKAATESAMGFGYTLGVQLHKLIGVA